jgi:hypothetical protein
MCGKATRHRQYPCSLPCCPSHNKRPAPSVPSREEVPSKRHFYITQVVVATSSISFVAKLLLMLSDLGRTCGKPEGYSLLALQSFLTNPTTEHGKVRWAKSAIGCWRKCLAIHRGLLNMTQLRRPQKSSALLRRVDVESPGHATASPHFSIVPDGQVHGSTGWSKGRLSQRFSHMVHKTEGTSRPC